MFAEERIQQIELRNEENMIMYK